jgi:energy-coupling factor transport system substrate-specific component
VNKRHNTPSLFGMGGCLERMRGLWAHQGIRFLAVGGGCAALTWGLRFPLSLLMPFGADVVVASLIGMGCGFVLYKRYVFAGSSRSTAQQGFWFIIVNLASSAAVFGLSLGFFRLVRDVPAALALREGFAHGLAIGMGAVINFVAHKAITFKRRAGNSFPPA